MATNCPHCGAPVVEKRQGYCFNCGTKLRVSKVPTILGCGLSVLLGLLGLGVILVCGAIAVLTSCFYGMSNSGPQPDLTPYAVGAVIGVLLILAAFGSLIYGIVAGVRGAKPPAPAPPYLPPPPVIPPPSIPVQPPAPEHLWAPAPTASVGFESPQPLETPTRPDDPGADQAQPKQWFFSPIVL